MTNEQKAKEICDCDNCKACIKFAEEGNYALNSTCNIYEKVTQAMDWKEKQMAARAKTFIKEITRVCDITDENGYRVDERYLLAELEKSMKGE